MLKEISELLKLWGREGGGKRFLFEVEIPEVSVCEEMMHSNKRDNMLIERELLSLDLSAHPLDFYDLRDGFTRIKNLPSVATGSMVKIAGSVIRYQTPPTRNGKRVVYVIMEDGTGVVDVAVFSDVQEKCGKILFRTGWLVVKGKVQRRGPKSLSIIALSLSGMRGIL